jgi:hypothetical protein
MFIQPGNSGVGSTSVTVITDSQLLLALETTLDAVFSELGMIDIDGGEADELYSLPALDGGTA